MKLNEEYQISFNEDSKDIDWLTSGPDSDFELDWFAGRAFAFGCVH